MRALLTSMVLLVACSPAAPEPKVAVAPKSSAAPPAPKPAPARARWLLTGSGVTVAAAQVDLGAQGIFQVGSHGRRWLLKSDGTVSASSFLLASHLVGARRDGTRWSLLGEDGTVFVADEPLGPPTSTRAAPKTSGPTRFAMGKSAIVGAEEDGTLHRSTGAAWSKSKLPVGPGEVVHSVAANARGEILVLIHPQRVLYSADDGATFAPLATPGIGASSLKVDANDDLWLEGAIVDKMAKLGGSPRKLEIATSFAELAKADTGAPKPPPAGTRTVIGDRIVHVVETLDVVSHRKKITVAVGAFDGKTGEPWTLATAASALTRVRVAGSGGDVVVDLHEPDADPSTSRLFRTTDDGKTWQPIGALEGHEGTGFRVLAGAGWVAVGELCTTIAGPCSPARAKLGAKDWQPLDLPPKLRLASAEVDAARDRVFVLGDEAGTLKVFTGKRDGKLTKIDLSLPGRPAATTLDSKGGLRLVYASPWRLLRLSPEGKLAPTLYLPFDVHGVDLAGDRGYAWGDEQAWETADGGEHWTKVALGATGPVACAPSGCLQGGSVRVGWELPDPEKALIAATTQPIKDPSDTPHDAPAAAGPPIAIQCAPSGPPKKASGQLWLETRGALDGDVRLVAPVGDDDKTTGLTVVKGSAPPSLVQLLPPPPKANGPRTVRDWDWTTAAGVVLARYSYSTEVKFDEEGGKKYNPVDVDLAWYAAAQGKVHKAKLPKVKPFRVGRVAPSALTEIVDGGLLFLAHTGESPIYFVHDDGKVETFARPTGADAFGFNAGSKIGKRIILAQQRFESVALISSEDLGKTWSRAVWTLGEEAALQLVGGKPALVLASGLGETSSAFIDPRGMIPFDAITPDPPAALRLSSATTPSGSKAFVPCAAKTKAGLRMFASGPEWRPVKLSLTGADLPSELTTHGNYVRIGRDGAACTDAMLVTANVGDDDWYAYVPADDPGHAFLLKRLPDDAGKFSLRPLACSLKP
ncbi:MAG: hypothetical protein HYV09_30150 [Deltaproteobacteria bacterium]|nr:hypothetical protein [Deltaproteobacteria bacterium]